MEEIEAYRATLLPIRWAQVKTALTFIGCHKFIVFLTFTSLHSKEVV